jgi:hypothetical protein
MDGDDDDADGGAAAQVAAGKGTGQPGEDASLPAGDGVGVVSKKVKTLVRWFIRGRARIEQRLIQALLYSFPHV